MCFRVRVITFNVLFAVFTKHYTGNPYSSNYVKFSFKLPKTRYSLNSTLIKLSIMLTQQHSKANRRIETDVRNR